MGDPPGPTGPPYAARRRFARRLSVHSGREGKAASHPFPLSLYTAQGGLRQAPGRVVQSPAEAGATPPSAADLPRRAAALVAAAAEGPDAQVTTGVMSAGAWL